MVVVAAGVETEILRHARGAMPEECCGVLVGTFAAGEWTVVEAVALENVSSADRHVRYEADPRGILAADKAARARGLDVIGFYHSHPVGEGRPSGEDLRLAWEGYLYVIAEMDEGRGAGRLRAWRFVMGRAEEIAVKVES